jgi:glutathione synthase/RimK-type ligase-like ATP-grasp enzyme
MPYSIGGIMKFLILTEPDDTHAFLVKAALEQEGYPIDCLFMADHPTKMRNSVYVDNKNYSWQGLDGHNNYRQKLSTIDEHNILAADDSCYDIVWWRRVRKPHLPKFYVHAEDYNFVMRENVAFFESITHNFAPHAWWVNPKEAAGRANSKLLQLRLAALTGFSIPQTLCSNDPQEVEAFLLAHQKTGVIYKPLSANLWVEQDQVKIIYTSRVTYNDLPHAHMLQALPGIFQCEISKKYELRVTCFGDYIVAAKINAKDAEKMIDWRAETFSQDFSFELYELPAALKYKIRLFMRKLGIVFGCFDFIVTPDDDYVFLEVNEQGQFLWLEEYNEDIPVLDIFIKFMLHRRVNFTWDGIQKKYKLSDYRDRAFALRDENMAKHVDLNHFTLPVSLSAAVN